MTRSRLLGVCTVPAWPVRDGVSMRVANLVRELSARWDVTLLSPGAPPPGVAHAPIPMGGPGATYPWRFAPAPLAAAIAAQPRPDVALVWPGAEAAWLAQRDPPPAVMDMIDCNPLEFWRGLGAGPWRDRLRSLRELPVAARHARQVVRALPTMVVGEQDAGVLRRLGGRNVHVVPLGVALPGDVPPADPAPTACFTGTLDYAPNAIAVAWLLRDIWPAVRAAVPGARLIIAGRRPAPALAARHGRDGVEVAADVPDMTQVIGRAWAAVAPMRSGVGIKIKVLEAWACGRPVVMTSRATNGLELPPGCAPADTARGLAGALATMLSDRAASLMLGAAARAVVLRTRSWPAMAALVDAQLARSLARAPHLF